MYLHAVLSPWISAVLFSCCMPSDNMKEKSYNLCFISYDRAVILHHMVVDWAVDITDVGSQ